MNAPFNSLKAFHSVAALRDTVLATRPTARAFRKKASPGEQAEHELLTDAGEAMRDGHLFVFNPFELDSDSFLEHAKAGVTAFAEGLTGLPYPVFCGVAGLTIDGETRLAMVMAKEVDNLAGADGRDLGEGWWVHAVVPWHLPSGDVWFEPVSRLIRLFAEGGKTFGRPFEPPIGEFATEMLGAQVEVLAVMLAMIADNRIAVTREVAPVKINAARAKRNKIPIPAIWKVDARAASGPYTTTIGPKQAHGENHGRHHRPPCPHSRRGHQRRLSTGRLTWVRSCAVNELGRYLTRRRDFYALNLNHGDRK